MVKSIKWKIKVFIFVVFVCLINFIHHCLKSAEDFLEPNGIAAIGPPFRQLADSCTFCSVLSKAHISDLKSDLFV